VSLIPLRNRARPHAFAPAPPEAATREGRRNRRWAWGGAALGALVGGVAFLPASLVVAAVANASGERLLLAEAEGSVWNGSALAVLSAGPGSRDAAIVLPSRLAWRLRPRWNGLALRLVQDCCIAQGLDLNAALGWQASRVRVEPGADGLVAQWPAGWLEGLGFPWNTLHPGGLMRLSTQALSFVRDGGSGAWRMDGHAQLEIRQASASLATLDTLGSYRLGIDGGGGSGSAGPAPDSARLTLTTLEGALILEGSGDVGPRGVHFHGQARAAAGAEAALNNLLNIIGRRNGALSVISIG